MDASLRQSIIKQMVGKSTPVTLNEDGEQPEVQAQDNEKSLFEFRKMLGAIHKYEAKIRKDDVEWSTEDWNGFRAYIGQPLPKKSTGSMLESVYKSKELREKKEADEKTRVRNLVLKQIKGF